MAKSSQDPCQPVAPGLFRRLQFYGARNGYLYSVLSYAGRKAPAFWRYAGPLFTYSKITTWLQGPGPHILNLGGGSNVRDCWLTADIDPRSDAYLDITKPIPIPDAAVDVVFLEEVVEHIARNEAEKMIGECFRILKPAGYLRLTTPDLNNFVSSFDGTLESERKINNIFYMHGHKHIFCRQGILELLRSVGFDSISASSFREAESKFGHLDTHAYRFEVSDSKLTQYWEAQKRASRPSSSGAAIS